MQNGPFQINLRGDLPAPHPVLRAMLRTYYVGLCYGRGYGGYNRPAFSAFKLKTTTTKWPSC